MKIIKDWTKFDLLKLTFFKNVNSTVIQQVVELYNSYDEFTNSPLPTNLNLIFNQGQLFQNKQSLPENEAEKQFEIIEKNNFKLISIWEKEYPLYLKHIYLPPTFIFVKGQLQSPEKNAIAIVGTRKCSHYGKIQTEKFAEYLAQREIIIVSGMAYGIDTIAHKSAINAGGITYAVIASGLDCISPSTAIKTSDEIIDSGGAIISIFNCKTKALPAYFLHRNRIISGLSKGIVITESRKKGGALNTARFARDQNREVYAVPGNLSSEQSGGTNKLIADNLSKLALSPEFVMKDLGIENNFNISINEIPELNFQNESERILYEALTYEPIHIDELIVKTELDTAQVMVDLLNLEFRNLIRQVSGKNYYKV